MEFPHIRILDELVQTQIQEVKLRFYHGPTLLAAKVSDSHLSEEILECEFLKQFSTLTFGYYSRGSDPV